jgi:hypothetical protein
MSISESLSIRQGTRRLKSPKALTRMAALTHGLRSTAILTAGQWFLRGGDRGETPFAGHSLEFVSAAILKLEP